MPGGHFREPHPDAPVRAVLEDEVVGTIRLLVRPAVHRCGGEGGEDTFYRAGRQAREGARDDALGNVGGGGAVW